LMTMR